MSHETTVARRQVEITNSLGLHMRPANKFVELALQFQAEIRVHYNGNEFNGKSILDLTSLAAECGTRLELEARGPDAAAAVEALADLVSARFHEDENGEPTEASHARSRLHELEGPRIPRPAGRSARSGAALRSSGAGARSLDSRVTTGNPGMRPSAISEPTSTARRSMPMQVLRGRRQPGIAIGPVVVLDPRGCGCRPARSPPRRSPPSSNGSIAGWTPRAARPARTRPRPGRGSARSMPTSWRPIAG